MKTFDEALGERIKALPYTPHLDDGGYNDGMVDGFESGANWASQSPELINEILTKYHEWATNLLARTLDKWSKEEGNFEKAKARTRKEFIEFLNKQNKSK